MYRPVNHGYIETVIGPMYSGKSEELIRRLKRAKIYSGVVFYCRYSSYVECYEIGLGYAE